MARMRKKFSEEIKKRTPKQDAIKADRTVVCKLDKSKLPEDVVHKGHTAVIIQDLKVSTDNVQFERETYYSPSLPITYRHPPPPTQSEFDRKKTIGGPHKEIIFATDRRTPK